MAMPNNRDLAARLARIAELRRLKSLSSRAELARAQERRDAAQALLAECDEALGVRAAGIERLFGGENLDIAALGIGRAVLAALAGERDQAEAECEARQQVEGQHRSQSDRDRNLEQRACVAHRKAARQAAQKREDAAALESTILRLANPQRVVA
jgi:hypothetical protein